MLSAGIAMLAGVEGRKSIIHISSGLPMTPGYGLMQEYAGQAGIGHVRYATCGTEDRSYAQPFERHHLEKRKWFSFGFNGQLANYQDLRKELLADGDHHLARETDTEIIMHEISREFAGPRRPGGDRPPAGR